MTEARIEHPDPVPDENELDDGTDITDRELDYGFDYLSDK